MNSPSRPWLMTSVGGRSFSAASSSRITSSRCGPSGIGLPADAADGGAVAQEEDLDLPVSPPQAATGTVRSGDKAPGPQGIHVAYPTFECRRGAWTSSRSQAPRPRAHGRRLSEGMSTRNAHGHPAAPSRAGRIAGGWSGMQVLQLGSTWVQRRRPDSNRGMTALQAVALPLGYGAGEPILSGVLRQRQVRFDASFSYNRQAMTKRRHKAIEAVRILSRELN